MNMLEALQAATDGSLDAWARPVSWRGSGQAICYRPGDAVSYASPGWLLVPTSRGGQQATMPGPDDLFGEWEVVSPEMVNTELGRAGEPR